MKKWTKLGVGLAALVLAVTAAGGAYAMFGGDDAGGEKVAAEDSSGPGSGMAMCAPGVTDCVDVAIGDEDAGGTRLADGECPPDHACIEPWLMDPPVCPDGVDVNECFPTETICADPGVVDPNTLDPTEPGDLPVDPEAERLAADGRLAEPCVDTPAGTPCTHEDVAADRCLPPDCAVSSDGAVVCKQDYQNGASGAGTDSVAPDAGVTEPQPVQP